MKRTTYLIILLTAVMAAPVLAGQIIYVDTYAAGNDAGSSWTNAYNHLQDALSAAAHGDEIRVANGVYKPDLGIGITPGERTASFQLKPGVVIEGGYAGSGSPDPNARNIELYKTVLSGDLDNDDDPNFANNIENSYHVVTGSDTYADSVLDGFTISGGNADASGDDRGGGMYNYLGSPKVINCTFTGNSAIWGGGVHNDNSSRPLLINCRFVANSTDYQGAGMYNRAESSPLLLKCLFYRNTSGTNGGAIFNRDDSHPAIINCTLVQNESDSGAGIHNYNSNPLIINSIIWGNSDIGGSDESAQIQGGVPEINYSCIQGWTGALSGIGNTGSDPCFADSDNNDYHLKSQAGRWEPNNVSWVIDGNTSPCIDAGDPDSNWTEQLWPHGMHTNMGAFGGDRQASMSLSNAGNIADLNIDGFVNYEDLKLFSNKWLRREVLLSEDLDRNAVVSLADFAILADHWGWQGQGYEQFYSTATSELRRLVNEEYSYYNLRGVDWEDLFITYSDVLNNAEDPDVFAQHAAGLLANAQDMHLWVKVGEQHSLVFKRSIERNYNFDILPTLFPNWLDKNDRVSTGYIINGNIGYIWVV